MTWPEADRAGGTGAARVVVIVGTDHHPFNRLISWINDWLDYYPERVPGFFVQSGAAEVRPACAGAAYLTSGELSTLLATSDAVVCHGGGGSISDAWRRGHRPIVVPRLRRLGEHVDDHQVHFTAKLAERGNIRLATAYPAFAAALAEVTCEQRPSRDDMQVQLGSLAADVEATVARFGALVDELVSRPRHRVSLFDGFRRLRRVPVADAGRPISATGRAGGLVPAVSTQWREGNPSARAGDAGLPSEEQE